MSEAVIELKGITRHFNQGGLKIEVLRGIDMRIEKGEFVALQGASGSGKSTLLNILGLLDQPSSGTYLLDGRDVAEKNDDELSRLRNETFGFVFQYFHLIPYLTAEENVLLPGQYSDRPLQELRSRARELLDLVGLGDRISFKPGELSGGQQQRVAIARSLLNHPEVILADEPTGQLDSTTSQDIMRLFDRIHQSGQIIVLVTHDQNTAQHAKRRIVVQDGRLV